jgi:TM2 domain-containing membrane protein YozV
VVVLNLLLFGGAGSILLGQKAKGFTAIAVWMAGLFTFGIVSFLVAVIGAVDGYLQAQQLQAGHPIGPWTFFGHHV